MSLIQFLKQLWGNKRVRVVIILALVVLVSSIIWWIVANNNKPIVDNSAYLIDTPLSFNTDHRVDIAIGVYSANKFPKSVSIYPINDTDQVSAIDRFLLSTGKSTLKKTNVQNVYYSWSKGEDRVEYIPNSLKLTFKFSSPVTITTGVSIVTKDNASEYMQKFLKNYLGKDYQYINVNVISQGNRMRIEFNRSIDGIPLYISGLDSYSDYIITDLSGKLYQGSINLIDLNIAQKESVGIVDVSNLSTVLQSDLYPKEVFQGVYPNTIPVPKLKTGVSLDNLNDLEKAKASTAKSVTLGYYFFDKSYKVLAPVYRIEGEGNVVYKGKSYGVPVVVIANALDPKRVYLPK